MHGFDEAGFAVGSVTGVRWWNLDPDGHLEGSRAGWQPGENIARCLARSWHAGDKRHAVPDENCSCGFWAYWRPSATSPIVGSRPVLGVAEGYGDDTLIGDAGFRCAKARIIALCCMFKVTRPKRLRSKTGLWTPPPGMFWRGPRGMQTFEAFGGRPPSDLEEDEEALLAIANQLEYDYEVPVYSTAEGMLMTHPPTSDYLPAPACICDGLSPQPWTGMQGGRWAPVPPPFVPPPLNRKPA
jgi:hypothetical protein